MAFASLSPLYGEEGREGGKRNDHIHFMQPAAAAAAAQFHFTPIGFARFGKLFFITITLLRVFISYFLYILLPPQLIQLQNCDSNRIAVSISSLGKMTLRPPSNKWPAYVCVCVCAAVILIFFFFCWRVAQSDRTCSGGGGGDKNLGVSQPNTPRDPWAPMMNALWRVNPPASSQNKQTAVNLNSIPNRNINTRSRSIQPGIWRGNNPILFLKKKKKKKKKLCDCIILYSVVGFMGKSAAGGSRLCRNRATSLRGPLNSDWTLVSST